MRVLLFVSLALNLLVAGLVLGDILTLTGGGPGRGPRPAELALGPVARALDEDDRRAILDSLRGDPDLRPLGRGEVETGLRELATTLRADPFVPDAFRAALTMQNRLVIDAQAAVQGALLTQVEVMSPEERAAFADRLERQRLGR
jgi:uncharacterized membrane protein